MALEVITLTILNIKTMIISFIRINDIFAFQATSNQGVVPVCAGGIARARETRGAKDPRGPLSKKKVADVWPDSFANLRLFCGMSTIFLRYFLKMDLYVYAHANL